MARRKKRLVLDIGTSAIRLAELSPTKEGYQLSKYFQKETLFEPGTEEDERVEKQAEVLTELLKESKSRRRKAIIAVAGQSVFTRNRPLPPVPEHKVPQIVRYEIQQQIPFSLDQIALDYEVLDRNEAGGYEVMMTAIKVDVVEKQLEVLKRAKCGVDIVDVSPLAAYNWLEHTGEFGDDLQCAAVVDLGATTTDIVIRKDGQFKFTRSLHTGGNDITQAVAREFNMSFEDAERLKRERGFAPTGDAKRDGKGGEVIGRVLNRLVGEINRSIAFFRSQPGGGPVQRIILAGGGACMRNIVPYLQRQLNIEVRIAQPLAGLAVAPTAQAASDHPEQSCVALGLALRCVEEPKVSVNLVPPRVREMALQRERLMYWALTMVALVLILGARVPLTAKNEALAKQRIDRLNQVLAKYDPALVGNPNQRSDFEDDLDFTITDVNRLKARLVRIDKVQQNRTGFLGPLNAVFESRPRGGGVVLSRVEAAVFGGKNNTGAEGRARLAEQRQILDEGGEIYWAEEYSIAGFPGIDLGAKEKSAKGKSSSSSGSSVEVLPPNGFRLYGYASSVKTIKRYLERLENSGAFVEKGVKWYSGFTDRVPETTVTQSGSKDDHVLRFHIDVQFSGDPLAPLPEEEEEDKKKKKK